jgi:hypothetical protein
MEEGIEVALITVSFVVDARNPRLFCKSPLWGTGVQNCMQLGWFFGAVSSL